jgi:hypothetical protein
MTVTNYPALLLCTTMYTPSVYPQGDFGPSHMKSRPLIHTGTGEKKQKKKKSWPTNRKLCRGTGPSLLREPLNRLRYLKIMAQHMPSSP